MGRKNKRKRLEARNFDTSLHLGINYTQCCKIVLMFYNATCVWRVRCNLASSHKCTLFAILEVLHSCRKVQALVRVGTIVISKGAFTSCVHTQLSKQRSFDKSD